MIYFNFWLKSLLYYIVPGGYGYYRYLHNFFDPSYAQDRDKQHNEVCWKEHKKDGIRYRDYETYDEYKVHQIKKFNRMLKIKGGFTNRTILSYRIKFYRRFRLLPKYLSKSAHILCAGARQGTEVEVLHDLGFTNATGIDLNPGPDNKFVNFGDFMHLKNKDSSLDLIYSNCVDHAFDLDAFFSEHARVLKVNGYCLYDIATQEGGKFEAAEWESEESVFLLMLRHFKRVVKVETEYNWKWVLLQGKRHT